MFDARRQAFRALTRATRAALQAIYASETVGEDEKLGRKAEQMQRFRTEYAELKRGWGDYRGYDAWVAQANNASFGAQAAYDDLVPGFIALFQREGSDFARFYDAVRDLSRQPKSERVEVLAELARVSRHSEQADATPSR